MMTNKAGLKEILTLKLQELVSELDVDFAAIAFYDPINLEFRWRLALGSLNGRYTNIVVNSNKGICGRILKTKREFIVTNFPEELQDEFLEFPILIIEELTSAVSVPLLYQSQMIGVLMVGKRTCRNFGTDVIRNLKEAAERIAQSYVKESGGERTNIEEMKPPKQSALLSFFVDEKAKEANNLEIILLDQRITLLSQDSQQDLISIFHFLFDRLFGKGMNSKAKVIIELRSEQQFAIQIEMYPYLELSDEEFSCLAKKVRKLNGNIEMLLDKKITVLTMNFFLRSLVSDVLWDNTPNSYIL